MPCSPLADDASLTDLLTLSTPFYYPTLLDRLGVELPVVQAGMGGGVAGAALAAAVSEAGGLGTVGFLPPAHLRASSAKRAG